MKQIYRDLVALSISIAVLFITGKISPSVQGGALFSWGMALLPIIGFFASQRAILLSFVFRAFLVPGLGLPTFAATLYLSEQSILKKLAPVAVSALLFLCHPVGADSWVYALHWIPVVFIALSKTQMPVLQALASTLTAQAVGSCLWIYAHETTAHYWLTLCKIVWIERLCITAALMVLYYAIALISPFASKTVHKTAQSIPKYADE